MRTNRLIFLALLAGLQGCGDKQQDTAAAPKAEANLPAQMEPPPSAAPQQPHPMPPNPHALPGQPPIEPPATVPPVIAAQPGEPDRVTANFMTVETKLPAAWQSVSPSNSMRLAQFTVPAAKGSEAGELVVFYFPAGGGGRQQENIARWSSQFSTPDGQAVQPAITQATVNKLNVTLVELNGSYSRGVGMGSSGAAKPDQTLLAAIIITPDQRNITLHLYGPKATIDAQRPAWDAMIKSLKQVR